MNESKPSAQIAEGVRLIDALTGAGASARLIGGAAIALHSGRGDQPHRGFSDLDLIVPGRDSKVLHAVLGDIGYEGERRFNALNADRRLIFHGPEGKLDVFVEQFKMCHEIPLIARLALDERTITATDLLLTKLQVVELNDKDIDDARLLLASHELNSGEGDWVNVDYLGELLSNDWGLYRTFTRSLTAVASAAPELLDMVTQILDAVDKAPRTAQVPDACQGRRAQALVRCSRGTGRVTPTGGGAAKLSDVAGLAGVSTSTVSRYVRGLPVRQREAIAVAIEQLGYRPNAIARGLRSRVTQAIGVILEDITNPYLAPVARGIQSIEAAQHYNLYLVGVNEGLTETIADLGSRVDGIICGAASDAEVIDALRKTGQPTVLLEFEPVGVEHGFDSVVVDNAGGARQAAGYLLQLGHERIGLISGPLSTSPGKERYDGFVGALADAGKPIREQLIEFGDFSSDSGYQAAARLLAGDDPVTAIFSANNLMSLGALKCIHDLGLVVPDEVSFVGFDPIDWSELFRPSPTTVERPRAEQVAIAMRLLQDRIQGKALTHTGESCWTLTSLCANPAHR